MWQRLTQCSPNSLIFFLGAELDCTFSDLSCGQHNDDRSDVNLPHPVMLLPFL